MASPQQHHNPLLRLGALAWLAVFLIIVAAGLSRFDAGLVKTDVTELLPESMQTSASGKVLSHVAQASAREVWILISNPDAAQAIRAADALAGSLASQGLTARDPAETADISAAVQKLLAWRENFLTNKDRTWLTSTNGANDKAISSRAARLLYRPVSPTDWGTADDPLGFFENWLLAQGNTNTFTRISGRTAVKTPEGSAWFVLTMQTEAAISAVGEAPLTQAISKAEEAAIAASGSGTKVLAAGIPLISEAVAQRASREATLIGAISMAGIALVILAFFARIAPIIEAAGVLLFSIAFAFAATLLTFGEIHVITIVFGATLLGICVDYVFHLLCAAVGGRTAQELRAALFKPLTASLVSTLAGYAIMLATPMPGLRQVSVFCMAGLVCTYLSVLLWMARFAPNAVSQRPSSSSFFERFASGFARLPRLSSKKSRLGAAAVALVFTAAGLVQLTSTNELRLINGADPELLARQGLVSSLLNPASPSQFFVVEGKDDCEVLERIDELQSRFSPAAGELAGAGIIAPTRFLASCSRQTNDRALVSAANARAREAVSELLDEHLTPAATAAGVLHVKDWERIVPEALSRAWISPEKAVVLISGVTPKNVAALAALAQEFNGITFVDTTADISQSLSVLRDAVLKALGLAAAAIAIVLVVFFRRQFLTLWIPSIAGILLTLALMGWCGIALSLFSVLPLVLVLGLGVDYAIMLQNIERAPTAANSVFLAAASTLLAFGLLAFSATPALHLFGMTLAVALALVLVLTVLLRPGKEA